MVTVQLAPTFPNTLVFGVPVALPPGPPTRRAVPNIAVISIHPPSPCRAVTTGFTVVFTPVIPPGPPG